jgi:hypothetical protein
LRDVFGERPDTREVVDVEAVEIELHAESLLELRDELDHAEGVDDALEEKVE